MKTRSLVLLFGDSALILICTTSEHFLVLVVDHSGDRGTDLVFMNFDILLGWKNNVGSLARMPLLFRLLDLLFGSGGLLDLK